MPHQVFLRVVHALTAQVGFDPGHRLPYRLVAAHVRDIA
jgi:hypothetical protein